MKFVFKENAAHQLSKLDQSVRIRILKKLQFFSAHQNSLLFAEPLKDPRFGNWKFRIGDYRVLFDVEGNTIVILKVGHRRSIYK
ncbi:MAG: type II toxin-antitoxin system RelE/ParE family toxin [Patescibacteria group bacterium]